MLKTVSVSMSTVVKKRLENEKKVKKNMKKNEKRLKLEKTLTPIYH